MSRWALLVLLLVVRRPEARREYEMIIEGVDVVRDPKFVLKCDFLRVAKYNETTFVVNLSGNLTEDLPLDTMLSLTAYEKSNSNAMYSMIPVKLINSRLCDVIKNEKLFYPPMLPVSNFPTACPMKKGHYWIKNFIPNLKTLPDQLPGERWRGEQIYTSKGRTLFKMNAFFFLKKI